MPDSSSKLPGPTTGMKKTRWLNFIICLPYTLLVSYPYVLLLSIFAAHNLRMESDGTLTAVWRDWASKVWRWSTTLGHGVIFQKGLRPPKGTPIQKCSTTWSHEGVHVSQTQDLMMTSFFIGLIVFLTIGIGLGAWSFAAWLGLALWASGGLWQAFWFLSSGFRWGFTLEGVYRQSEHERSARAQTQRWCRRGKTKSSWLKEEMENLSNEQL